jgi:hypothetical protein
MFESIDGLSIHDFEPSVLSRHAKKRKTNLCDLDLIENAAHDSSCLDESHISLSTAYLDSRQYMISLLNAENGNTSTGVRVDFLGRLYESWISTEQSCIETSACDIEGAPHTGITILLQLKDIPMPLEGTPRVVMPATNKDHVAPPSCVVLPIVSTLAKPHATPANEGHLSPPSCTIPPIDSILAKPRSRGTVSIRRLFKSPQEYQEVLDKLVNASGNDNALSWRYLVVGCRDPELDSIMDLDILQALIQKLTLIRAAIKRLQEYPNENWSHICNVVTTHYGYGRITNGHTPQRVFNAF